MDLKRWEDEERVGVVARPCHPFQLFLSRSVYKQRLVEDMVVKCALKMQFVLTESCRSFLTVSKLDVFTYSSINYIVISKKNQKLQCKSVSLHFCVHVDFAVHYREEWKRGHVQRLQRHGSHPGFTGGQFTNNT